MLGKLGLPPKTVDRCRSLAREVAAGVRDETDRFTTAATEGAVARLLGVDGVVLSIGTAAGGSTERIVARALAAAELVRLPAVSSGARQRNVAGALTDAALDAIAPAAGETLVVEDFASVFLSAGVLDRLRAQGVALAARRPSRLLAVTTNPTAPGETGLRAEELFEATAKAFPGILVVDLVAGLKKGDKFIFGRE